MIRCSVCRTERDDRQVPFFQRVSGWARINRKGGGVNALRQMEREDLFVCQGCLLASEIDGNQLSLEL